MLHQGGYDQAHVKVVPWDHPVGNRVKYLFRKQRGVNLGSWFALESWLTGSLFKNAKEPSSCDIDLVKGMKPDDAKALLEDHWDNFINDGDWSWMKAHGINSVRIPILYPHFLAGNPKHKKLLKGTEYGPYDFVYEGAWKRIVKAIEKARSLNIGVLIDVHGVPGGQNGDSHCGKSDGNAGFWHGSHASSNRKVTIKILVALAEAISCFENVIGLELMNEPQNHNALESFYAEAIKSIRCSSKPDAASMPLYVGDAWDTNHYTHYVGKHTSCDNPLVVDHHLYRCFTPNDHKTTAAAHANHLDVEHHGKTAVWLEHMANNAKNSIIIGEWSGALNPGSFQGCNGKLEARKQWSLAQWRAFEKLTAGYYYWTLKKEGGPDPGWCLYTAIEKGSMPPSLNPLDDTHVDLNLLKIEGEKCREQGYMKHVKYWDNKGGHFDHEQYNAGFKVGWFDALDFLADGAEIGLPFQLVQYRIKSYRKDHDHKFIWEFEHGYTQALNAFRRVLYA
jgi:hypothetical protein